MHVAPGCLISCARYRDVLLVVSVRPYQILDFPSKVERRDMAVMLCVDREGLREIRLPADGGSYRVFPADQEAE